MGAFYPYLIHLVIWMLTLQSQYDLDLKSKGFSLTNQPLKISSDFNPTSPQGNLTHFSHLVTQNNQLVGTWNSTFQPEFSVELKSKFVSLNGFIQKKTLEFNPVSHGGGGGHFSPFLAIWLSGRLLSNPSMTLTSKAKFLVSLISQ